MNVTFIRGIIPVINNLGTPSSELQINFGVLQIDIKNSATGHTCIHHRQNSINELRRPENV